MKEIITAKIVKLKGEIEYEEWKDRGYDLPKVLRLKKEIKALREELAALA